MTRYVALLRAVNVGTGRKLEMAALRALCDDAGFVDVKTYIQSGNVVFSCKASEAKVKAALEKAVTKKVGKPIGVLVRTAQEIASVLKRNPFPKAPTNRVIVFFLDDKPGALPEVACPSGEELVLSGREIFVRYPDGQGRSKLKVPFANVGTGRNLNTVAKLAEMAAAEP